MPDRQRHYLYIIDEDQAFDADLTRTRLYMQPYIKDRLYAIQLVPPPDMPLTRYKEYYTTTDPRPLSSFRTQNIVRIDNRWVERKSLPDRPIREWPSIWNAGYTRKPGR